MSLATHSSSRLLWRAPAYWPRAARPSPLLREWLINPGSLTARLVAKSAGQFRVDVVRQIIGRPRLNECQVLGIPVTGLALIREVVLFGRDKPWVFARSVLPLSSLTGELRHLRKQANRPLGAFLFSQPHLVRSPITLARIGAIHDYVPARLINMSRANGSDPTILWGRRSVFSLRGKPLLVSEVFLPDFIASLAQGRA